METSAVLPKRAQRLPALFGLTLFAIIVVLGLTWAKWDPYARKLSHLISSRHWTGKSVLAAAGQPAASPSWHGAWSFALAYGKAIWIALVAGLLISAAIDALVPRRWIVGLLTGRTTTRGTLVSGLLAMPCMMCTCCSAPIVDTLRRRGVPTSSVLAYWLGNPVLNPAVLVFLALVAPWQWTLTRVLAGACLVFGGSVLAARAAAAKTLQPAELVEIDEGPAGFGDAAARFARTLSRLTLTLVPEYIVIVLALGAFRGWLFPLGANAAHWGLLALLIAVVAGTLIVIPTAGEIPILQGLSILGAGPGVLGALLITLPAVSLPSLVMVGRSLTWRVTAAVAATVAVAGLLGAGLLTLIA